MKSKIKAEHPRHPEDELLDSIQEYPTISDKNVKRLFHRHVMNLAFESWPDDVPMPGGM